MKFILDTLSGWFLRRDLDQWHPSPDAAPVMLRKINGKWEERPMDADELREHERALEEIDNNAW